VKRFVFRLQAVLDLKERAEEQAQQALGTALRAVAETEQAMARLIAQRDQTLRGSADAAPEARAAAWAWAEALNERHAEAQHQLVYLRAEVETRRSALARVAAERRAVEKLRERALNEYRAELQRREQIQLDEIAGSRHEWARRQAG
jgi:flagellar export protein FliJ